MQRLLFLLLFLVPLFGHSQIVIEGVVKDQETKEALIGAYVISTESNTVTDVDGSFTLEVSSLPIELTVSYVGYKEQKFTVIEETPLYVNLIAEQNILDIMTVTASKYEKRLSESTVSVEVLKPDLIASVNTIDIDAALDKVPGVQMVDGQANIRGGSGYSYGAGSRVMLLIDDVPALQVDAGFPNWGDVPVENIAQVEVLKGAASALYGSSALNGIINIRTGTPTATPQTKFSAAYTTFGDTQDSLKQWWGDTTRYQYTMTLLHKQKFGKLDVVAGGFYSKLESFNRYTFQNRRRANVKLQYQLSDKAFLRLNTLINKGDNGDFFIWDNDSTGLYQPFGDNPATSSNFRYFVDPSLHVEDNYRNTHKILTRYHRIKNDNNNDQGNVSNTLYGEYQVQRKLEKLALTATAGALLQSSDIDAELFGDTTFSARNIAAYLQLDKTFFEKLNLSGGLRYEHNRQLTPENFNGLTVPDGKIEEGELIARLGASYEYAPYSALRASWGQGYRLPTITEKFITTSFAGFNILPNPDLQSERGWTAEIGIKQAFKLSTFKGYVDVSLFTSEYSDMTEFTADFSDFNNFGFSSQNVGDTKINGFDLGLFAAINIAGGNLGLYGGYTYLNPKYQNFGQDSLLTEGLSTDQNFLKYRTTHNVKMDVQYTWKAFTVGAAFVHASNIVNIDRPLENLFGAGIDLVGIGRFREQHPNGYVRMDLRASYSYKNAKVSFLVNNIGNEEYTVRPGLMEAPINYSLRLDYNIDWK